ncbi:MAG: hypothetical protein ACI31F_03060 [Muribaculaceae bacterium]
MKQLLLFATALFAAVMFTSCGDDESTPMTWDFYDYDSNFVTAVYTPDYINQVSISAIPEYQGEITLKCTNYPEVAIMKDNKVVELLSDTQAGFSVKRIDDNTLKISFHSIMDIYENRSSCIISIVGNNGDEKYFSNIIVFRK